MCVEEWGEECWGEGLEKGEVKFIAKLFSIKMLIILNGHFAVILTPR